MRIPTTDEINFVHASLNPAMGEAEAVLLPLFDSNAVDVPNDGRDRITVFGVGYYFGLKVAEALATTNHDPAVDSWFFGTYEPEFYRCFRSEWEATNRKHFDIAFPSHRIDYIRAITAEYRNAQSKFEEFHAIARAEDEGMIAREEELLG